MGYTSFTKQIVQKYIDVYKPQSVIDLGSQNDFSYPELPAPYISEWYKENKILYNCIDINGENNALKIDLARTFYMNISLPECDLMCDCGTTEHLEIDGKFDWVGIYTAWLTKHYLLKIGGIMYNENPKTGNWAGHGYNYYSKDFYMQLSNISGYEILELGEHPACGNVTDGWNIYAVLKKTKEDFITLAEFKTLSLFQS